MKTREELMDELDDAYNSVSDIDIANQIIDKHNASPDDSGENGFMDTMSDEDMQAAIDELNKAANRSSLDLNNETVVELKDICERNGYKLIAAHKTKEGPWVSISPQDEDDDLRPELPFMWADRRIYASLKNIRYNLDEDILGEYINNLNNAYAVVSAVNSIDLSGLPDA